VDTAQLESLVLSLIEFSEMRSDNQGLVVYRNILTRIDQCGDGNELSGVIELLKKALAGMEAHGYFSDKELVIVDQIKKINMQALGGDY
jgi:hypothetical protein